MKARRIRCQREGSVCENVRRSLGFARFVWMFPATVLEGERGLRSVLWYFEDRRGEIAEEHKQKYVIRATSKG